MAATPAVELFDDAAWVNECYVHDDGVHEHVGVYLLRAGDAHVLVDTGSFNDREAILAAVRDATDGRGLDAVILSHSDYRHSANVGPLERAWGDVELVASSGAPAQQGLPESARKATIGESLTVCGREFSFIDPPLADRSHTTWIFDHGDGILFTADGFGAVHAPGDCALTSRDLDDGVAYEAVRRHLRETLVWLRYVDPAKLRDALWSILDRYDPALVAPIHGPPVYGADIEGHVETLLRAAEAIAEAYEVPTAD